MGSGACFGTGDDGHLRLGVDEGVEVGDEVVLLGEQGGESIRAEEFARWADTSKPQVMTGINTRRVERSYRKNEVVRRSRMGTGLQAGRVPGGLLAARALRPERRVPGDFYSGLDTAAGVVSMLVNAVLFFFFFAVFTGSYREEQEAPRRRDQGPEKRRDRQDHRWIEGQTRRIGRWRRGGADDLRGRQNPNTSRKKAARRRRR